MIGFRYVFFPAFFSSFCKSSKIECENRGFEMKSAESQKIMKIQIIAIFDEGHPACPAASLSGLEGSTNPVGVL